MTTEWIKISEHRPTASDLPVVISGPGYFKILNVLMPSETFHTDVTHWKQFRDAPPKEPTQEELDQRAFTEWSDSEPESRYIAHESRAWNRGIAYERSAIRHLIQRHRNGELPGPEVIRMISGRVKL